MKKTLFSLTAFLCFNIYSSCFAQYSHSAQLASTANISAEMPESGEAALKWLHPKAYTRFHKQYKNAMNIHIQNENENTFVSCTIDGIKHHMLYNRYGKNLYTTVYYPAEKAPDYATEIVTEEFRRFTILRAVELNTRGCTTYFVDIQYKNDFKTIRISEGKFDVYKHYQVQE